MGRAEDRKPSGIPIPQHSRMDDEAQLARSNAFRQGTQGPGKPMTYGTGKPPEAPKKGRKS